MTLDGVSQPPQGNGRYGETEYGRVNGHDPRTCIVPPLSADRRLTPESPSVSEMTLIGSTLMADNPDNRATDMTAVIGDRRERIMLVMGHQQRTEQGLHEPRHTPKHVRPGQASPARRQPGPPPPRGGADRVAAMNKRWRDGSTISEETSLSLLARVRQGDNLALEALMGRHLGRLQRWASGRVPARARGMLDTDDVVQDALLNTFRRLDDFEPRHDGALMAYLREAVANRIRSELRRRCPDVDTSVAPDDIESASPSPLEALVGRDAFARYETALAELDEDERAAVIGRFEMGYSYDAIARALNRPSADAARKAVERAVRRLAGLMRPNGS